MARVAYVMEGIMSKLGLIRKGFYPHDTGLWLYGSGNYGVTVFGEPA